MIIKILIVSQYFWPENFRINDLAIGFQEQGHDVTVLTGMPNYPSGSFFAGYNGFNKWREDYHGIKIVRVPLFPRGKGGKLSLVLNYISFALSASVIGPFRCHAHYDAIFVHEPSPISVGFPAIVLKTITKAPIFFWVLDLWPQSLSAAGGVKSRVILGVVERMVTYIYQRCDKVLVQSRRFIPEVKRFGVDDNDIIYFPSWAEDLYQPVEYSGMLREKFGLPCGFYIMFAGNIGASQDFESILLAAEKLREHTGIHWLIVGDGRMSEWVQQEVSRRRLNRTVHMLGRHDVEKMPQFFSFADVMLVTLKHSPTFAMTIPGKVQSYLACGRPIIAMLDGEGGQIVEESGAGFSCSAEDSSALARLVKKMAIVPKPERERMGGLGRKYYEEHFDRSRLFARLESWMKQSKN